MDVLAGRKTGGKIEGDVRVQVGSAPPCLQRVDAVLAASTYLSSGLSAARMNHSGIVASLLTDDFWRPIADIKQPAG